MLVALLPLDDAGRTRALVGIAFQIRAVNVAALAERHRQGLAQVVAALVAQLTAAIAAGEIRPEIEPEIEAELLLACTEGIGSALLVGRYDAERALAVLDHQLGRLRSA